MDQRALLELEDRLARVAVGLVLRTRRRGQVWPVIGFFSSAVSDGNAVEAE